MNGEFYQKVKKNIDLTWYNYNFQLCIGDETWIEIYIYLRSLLFRGNLPYVFFLSDPRTGCKFGCRLWTKHWQFELIDWLSKWISKLKNDSLITWIKLIFLSLSIIFHYSSISMIFKQCSHDSKSIERLTDISVINK